MTADSQAAGKSLEETMGPIDKALMKFFPCRLGKYTIPVEDGSEEEVVPVEDQREVCSSNFIARYLHSWPMEKVMGVDEFFEYQTSISIGCPDWDYRVKVWRPMDNHQEFDRENGNTIVFFTMQVHATHSVKTKFFDQDIAPANTKVVMPAEMGHVVLNEQHQIEYFESWKVVHQEGNTTGDLCGVPGLLFAMGRPLPPPATELLAPIPPYTAPDNRDPNWKLRIQVFKQICNSHPLDKKALKTLILRQKDELRQKMDYLQAIRNYCGEAIVTPGPGSHTGKLNGRVT